MLPHFLTVRDLASFDDASHSNAWIQELLEWSCLYTISIGLYRWYVVDSNVFSIPDPGIPDTAIIRRCDNGVSWYLVHAFLTNLSTCSSMMMV